VWRNEKEKRADTSCIEQHMDILHSRYVFLGLNISKPLAGVWKNFHGGKHDRKLLYAINDTKLRGSYLTDMYKNIVEPKSNQLHKFIESQPDLLRANVDTFRNEMSDIGVKEDTVFVVLSAERSRTALHFIQYFKPHFPNNPVIFHRHYSYLMKDRDWVESFWNTLGINADFNSIIKKYKKDELQL
jgi:hypothetical protein